MDAERREFIKQSCKLCASLVGISAVISLTPGCSPLLSVDSDISSGNISVAKNNFTAENSIVLIKNKTLEFDIALVRISENNYKAFEMKCSHQANPLVPTKNGFFCNAHGSAFTLDGKVKNPPAIGNLREYKVEMLETEILVTI